jgi:hypothetical protein
LGGSGSWSGLADDQADREALALLLETISCGDAEVIATLLEPKPWWEQEQPVHSSEGPVVLALHEGSCIAAEQLTMRAVGYGNRSKGELPQQTGITANALSQRQAKIADGGWVTPIALTAHS